MAKRKADMTRAGAWAFLGGLLIAVILGFMPSAISPTNTVLVLGILGIIVGLINVTEKEVGNYLVANIAFLVASDGLLTLAMVIPTVGAYLANIVSNIIAFVAPGAAIVALKSIFQIAKR